MSQLSVPISTDTFLRLAVFLRESGSERDPVTVVEEAVEYWMANAEWKQESLLPDSAISEDDRGYAWKIQRTTDWPASALFLPSGTTLRIKVAREFAYATIEGDSLIYEGKSLSPNQFAYRAAGSARDAWRDLWVKRPTDSDYRHAQALRRETIGLSN
jgi:hypothetical protein